MSKQKKKGAEIPRLPMEAVKLLRSKGGAIRPKKGGRYDRAKEKQKRTEENS